MEEQQEQLAALQRQVEDAKVKMGMAERVFAAGTSGDVVHIARGTRPAPRQRSSAVGCTVSVTSRLRRMMRSRSAKPVNPLHWDKRFGCSSLFALVSHPYGLVRLCVIRREVG